MPSVVSKTERLEARLTRDQKRRIAEAARLKGTTVSEFVVSSLETAAETVLSEQHSTRLTRKAAEGFVRLLMNPPAPNKKLIEAAKLHRAWERRRG